MTTVTGCLTSSMICFQVVVKALMTMTPMGHPYKTPLAAAHHAPRHPLILNIRLSWEYIPRKARSTPASMPCTSSTAIEMACGIKSKHLV